MDGQIKWEQQASYRDAGSLKLHSTLARFVLALHVDVLPEILHRRKQKKQQTMQALIGLELGATDVPVIGRLPCFRGAAARPSYHDVGLTTINKARLRCW